jgi:hypothetical protein
MRLSKAGVLLVVIQLLLVSSIAGKNLYERKVCPRVWTRAASVDPDSPLRGRYLVLPLTVNVCGLPKNGDPNIYSPEPQPRNIDPSLGERWWAAAVVAREGRLVGVARPRVGEENSLRVFLPKRTPCDRGVLNPGTELYIPETAKVQPLKDGEELWVEVTVPPAGPPRAIQMAVSGSAGFVPIRMK